MGSLYNRLFIVLNEREPNSTFYHIALTMLKHMEHLQDISISELALLCNTSKSTISKFIRHIGYEDYADFRYAAVFLDNKYQYDFNFINNVMGFMENRSLETYLLTVIQDINATYQSLDWNAMEQLVTDLTQYERVAAFGHMFSETAALDLQVKLGYNKKFIITKQNDLDQAHFIENAGKDVLILIFSDSGEYLNRYGKIFDFANKKVFSRTKARIAVITSNPRVAGDPRADYCIFYKKSTSLCTHRIIYPILTDIIAYKYREHIIQSEQATQ